VVSIPMGAIKADVLRARRLMARGWSLRACAAQIGVSPANLDRALWCWLGVK
jgi:lambda repressor-like predicted transcriptional regulator